LNKFYFFRTHKIFLFFILKHLLNPTSIEMLHNKKQKQTKKNTSLINNFTQKEKSKKEDGFYKLFTDYSVKFV
jgi:hypothetical protein